MSPLSKNQAFSLVRLFLMVGIALAVPVAKADWLSAFGGGGQEAGSGLFETARGDYVLLGESATPNAPLVAALDAAGNLRWSKQLSAKWAVFPGIPQDPAAPVFFGPRKEDTSQFNWTRIGFDPSTGTPTIRYSKGFSSAVSGSFDVISAKVPAGAATENFIAGILNLPNGANPQQARDVLVAKLAADGSIAWSQVLNFGTTSTANPVVTNRPVVLKLVDGYLVSWSVTVHELLAVNRLPKGINGIVVAKFDAVGNPITSAFKFFETNYESRQTQNSEVNDWVVLPDSRILLGGKFAGNPSQFFLALFDGGLNLQWAKTYADPSGLARLDLMKVFAFSGGSPYAQVNRTLADQNGVDQERHALQLAINVANGEPTSQVQITLNRFDSIAFAPQSGRSVLVSGSSASTNDGKTTAFWGRFRASDLQPIWGKQLLGSRSDSAAFSAGDTASGLNLVGASASYGVGAGDMLAGNLDSNGTAGTCQNVVDFSASVSNLAVPIAAATLPSTLKTATINRKGFFLSRDVAASSVVVTGADFVQTKVCEPVPRSSGPKAPTVTIVADADNNGFLSEQERRGGAFEIRIDLPDTARLDDILTVTDESGFVRIERVLDGADISARVVRLINEFAAPAAGESLSVQATLTDAAARISPPGRDSVSGLLVTPRIFGPKTRLVLTGQDLGQKKGRLFVGTKRAQVHFWSDSRIEFTPRSIKAGVYATRILPNRQAQIAGPNVELSLPILGALSSDSGKSRDVVSVTGRYFGAGRPRVGFRLGQKRKFVRSLPGSSDTTLNVRVPKLRPGTYQLEVRTDAGTGSTAPLSFTVR